MSGSRHLTRLFGSTLFLAALGMGWPMGCTSGGLVGGECRFGLIECNGKCVNIGSDSSNCGSCGNVCSEGRTCMSGNCLLMSGTGSGGADSSMPGSDEAGVGGVGGLDGLGGGGSSNDGGSAGGILVPDGGATAAGGAIDSGLDAGLGPDSGSAGGGVGGSGNAGSGNTGGGSGGSPDASVVLCEAPFNSANNCGDCSTRCQGATPFCAPTDGGYGCVNSCADGLIPCGDVCADLDSDASNCGQCGRICPSGLCAGGECIGDTAGNLVLMCSSFDLVSENAPQTRILGNAVFVGINNPVRILMY